MGVYSCRLMSWIHPNFTISPSGFSGVVGCLLASVWSKILPLTPGLNFSNFFLRSKLEKLFQGPTFT